MSILDQCSVNGLWECVFSPAYTGTAGLPAEYDTGLLARGWRTSRGSVSTGLPCRSWAPGSMEQTTAVTVAPGATWGKHWPSMAGRCSKQWTSTNGLNLPQPCREHNPSLTKKESELQGVRSLTQACAAEKWWNWAKTQAAGPRCGDTPAHPTRPAQSPTSLLLVASATCPSSPSSASPPPGSLPACLPEAGLLQPFNTGITVFKKNPCLLPAGAWDPGGRQSFFTGTFHKWFSPGWKPPCPFLLQFKQSGLLMLDVT